MPAETDALAALPHAAPFRFITRVEEIEPGRAGRGLWQVTGREDFFAGHFPGRPVVPGVLLGEALAQLSGLVGVGRHAGAGGAAGRLAHVDMRFDRAVVPPADIVLRAEVVRTFGTLTQFDVRAELHGQVVARGTLALSLSSGAGPEVAA